MYRILADGCTHRRQTFFPESDICCKWVTSIFESYLGYRLLVFVCVSLRFCIGPCVREQEIARILDFGWKSRLPPPIHLASTSVLRLCNYPSKPYVRGTDEAKAEANEKKRDGEKQVIGENIVEKKWIEDKPNSVQRLWSSSMRHFQHSASTGSWSCVISSLCLRRKLK